MKKTLTIRIISAILLTAFLSQEIAWADLNTTAPRSSSYNLAIPSLFQSIRSETNEKMLEAAIIAIMKSYPDIQNFSYPLAFSKNGTSFSLDFDQKHIEGDSLVIPCSFFANGSREYYMAVIGLGDGSISLKRAYDALFALDQPGAMKDTAGIPIGNNLVFAADTDPKIIDQALSKEGIAVIPETPKIIKTIQRHFRMLHAQYPDRIKNLSSYQIEFRQRIKHYTVIEGTRIIVDIALIKMLGVDARKELMPFLAFAMGHEGSHALPSIGSSNDKAYTMDAERFAAASARHRTSILKMLKRLGANQLYIEKLTRAAIYEERHAGSVMPKTETEILRQDVETIFSKFASVEYAKPSDDPRYMKVNGLVARNGLIVALVKQQNGNTIIPVFDYEDADPLALLKRGDAFMFTLRYRCGYRADPSEPFFVPEAIANTAPDTTKTRLMSAIIAANKDLRAAGALTPEEARAVRAMSIAMNGLVKDAMNNPDWKEAIANIGTEAMEEALTVLAGHDVPIITSSEFDEFVKARRACSQAEAAYSMAVKINMNIAKSRINVRTNAFYMAREGLKLALSRMDKALAVDYFDEWISAFTLLAAREKDASKIIAFLRSYVDPAAAAGARSAAAAEGGDGSYNDKTLRLFKTLSLSLSGDKTAARTLLLTVTPPINQADVNIVRTALKDWRDTSSSPAKKTSIFLRLRLLDAIGAIKEKLGRYGRGDLLQEYFRRDENSILSHLMHLLSKDIFPTSVDHGTNSAREPPERKETKPQVAESIKKAVSAKAEKVAHLTEVDLKPIRDDLRTATRTKREFRLIDILINIPNKPESTHLMAAVNALKPKEAQVFLMESANRESAVNELIKKAGVRLRDPEMSLLVAVVNQLSFKNIPKSGKEASPDMALRYIPHPERNEQLAKLIEAGDVYRVNDNGAWFEQYEKKMPLRDRIKKKLRGMFTAMFIKKSVYHRLKHIRSNDGILRQMETSQLIDMSGVTDALKLSAMAAREQLRGMAQKIDILIVKDRLSLCDGGPITHARRGESDNRACAIWLGERLFTTPEISDDDIALVLLEEAKHLLAPRLYEHDRINHSKDLQEKLFGIAIKLGEKPGGTISDADMSVDNSFFKEAGFGKFIPRLSPTDQLMIKLRLEGKTLEEVGDACDYTKEGVRRRLMNIGNKLKRMAREEDRVKAGELQRRRSQEKLAAFLGEQAMAMESVTNTLKKANELLRSNGIPDLLELHRAVVMTREKILPETYNAMLTLAIAETKRRIKERTETIELASLRSELKGKDDADILDTLDKRMANLLLSTGKRKVAARQMVNIANAIAGDPNTTPAGLARLDKTIAILGRTALYHHDLRLYIIERLCELPPEIVEGKLDPKMAKQWRETLAIRPQEAPAPEKRTAKPYLFDIRDAKELTDNMIGAMISVVLSGKRLVLAFHKDIGGSEAKKIQQLLKQLNELKKKDGFDKILKNMVVITSYASPTDLWRELARHDIDLADKDHNAVFTFAPQSAAAADLGPAVRSVRIDEGKDFNTTLYYYPIFEIVTITLVKYLKGYSRNEIYKILADMQIKPGELNIKDIDSDRAAFLVFTLVPNAERYDGGKMAERYAILSKAINSAA